MSQNWIAIAIIRKTVGLEGYLAVDALGPTFDLLDPPCQVRVGREESAARDMVIDDIQERPKGYVVRFQGCEDKDSAEKYRGYIIFTGGETLPELENGTYYQFELADMEVWAVRADEEGPGERIGIVSEVVNLPSMDAVDVERSDGTRLLVPLTEQAVVRVDKSAKVIVVNKEFLEELI